MICNKKWFVIHDPESKYPQSKYNKNKNIWQKFWNKITVNEVKWK